MTNQTFTKKRDDLILSEGLTTEKILQKLKEPYHETDGETYQ